jgi:hypothetical protein
VPTPAAPGVGSRPQVPDELPLEPAWIGAVAFTSGAEPDDPLPFAAWTGALAFTNDPEVDEPLLLDPPFVPA